MTRSILTIAAIVCAAWIVAVLATGAPGEPRQRASPLRRPSRPMVEDPGHRALPPRQSKPGLVLCGRGGQKLRFDEQRNRLYVTTSKQLVVVDTKARKIIDRIDLLGSVRACDVAPDFKHLAVGPLPANSSIGSGWRTCRSSRSVSRWTRPKSASLTCAWDSMTRCSFRWSMPVQARFT